MFRAAISGRAVGRLFDIVRWDYRERFGDEPQFDARSSVLVPRSAGAVEVPQIRVGGRARLEGWSCKLGLRPLPVFVLFRRVIAGNPRPPTRRRLRGFPVVIPELTGPGAGCARPPVFLLLFTGKNRGTEWVGPRARSLIAASRLAMLAAVQGDNGVQ